MNEEWRDRYLRPAQWGVCGSCRQLGQGNTCPAHHGRRRPLRPDPGPDWETIAENRAERLQERLERSLP